MRHNSPPPSAFDPHIKRKSWFSFALRPSKASHRSRQSTHLNDGETSLEETRDPYRPVQFSPNRLATLYVTPSERNLYLAAMAQLDENPPRLALWSDPAPVLPAVEHQDPLDTSSSTVRPLTEVPLSPKLVTSPDLDRSSGGLQVRDEFRTIQPRNAKHALMALTGLAGMRFNGFPVRVLLAVDEIIGQNWPLKIVKRSEGVEMLQLRAANDTLDSWGVELGGTVWKRKGSQELGTIRLLLAVFTCLGTHGYTVVDSIRAASVKSDSHNFLLLHSTDTVAHPPLFFAVSFPLFDRISIISPPPKSTPAIISGIRQAITTIHNGKGDGSSRGAKASSNAIKLEGWVHRGVYRFWLGGMRRWLVGGIRRKVVNGLHPKLLLGVLNSLSALHFTLTASVPLLPFLGGRDVLIFSSLPSSGLSVRDTYVTLPDVSPSGSESPVVVSRNDLPPQPVSILRTGGRSAQPDQPRPAPWTADLGNSHPETPGTVPRQREVSEQSSVTQPPTYAGQQSVRSASRESQVPLVKGRGSAESSPRQRNVLLKKSSVRRKNSQNRSGPAAEVEPAPPLTNRLLPRAEEYPQRDVRKSSIDEAMQRHYLEMPAQYNHIPESALTDHMHQSEADRWSFVNNPIPPLQGSSADHPLGVTNPDPQRPSTAMSGDSLYFDPSADSHTANPIPNVEPNATSDHAPSPNSEMYETSPLRDATSPRQAKLVSVGSGLVPSMRGSVGFLGGGGQSVVSGYAPTVPEKDSPGEVPPPTGHGSARTRVNLGPGSH